MTQSNPIVVRRHGSQGRLVMVLHGGPGAPGSASGLAKLLASDHEVLEPLQRRSGTVPLTVARHVEDLAAVAPPCCAVVGHSWGAMLGLSYAATYPERVARLVLVGCGTYSESCRAELKSTVDARLGEVGRTQLVALRQELENAEDKETRDEALRKLGAVFAIVESYDPVDKLERDRDELPVDARGHDETWADVLRLQQQGIEPQRFSSITCPVILIQGDADPHPGVSTAALLKQFIPQLEYLGLERCGHEPWRERYARDVFVEALRVWLRR